MSEWEYQVKVESRLFASKEDISKLENELNKNGNQGWELAAGLHSAPDDQRVVLVFKRQKSIVESALQ